MDGDADNYRHCVFKLLIFSPLSLSVNTTPTFNIANTKADIVRNSKLSLIPVKNTTGQFKVKLYFFLVRGYRLHPPWGGTGTVLRGPIDTIKNAGNKNIRQEAFENVVPIRYCEPPHATCFTLPFTRCRYCCTPPLSHAACASMSTTTSTTTTTRDRGDRDRYGPIEWAQ